LNIASDVIGSYSNIGTVQALTSDNQSLIPVVTTSTRTDGLDLRVDAHIPTVVASVVAVLRSGSLVGVATHEPCNYIRVLGWIRTPDFSGHLSEFKLA